MAAGPGRIEVVATPIGNLADLAPRAREALQGADVVAAEDTRHTGTMLQALGLSRPLVSLHEHNERERIDDLLARLAAGQRVVLVSDAGTPLVSDPGYVLIRAAIAAGYAVSAIPGPSAVLAALTVAGLPTDRFCFEGFLPSREGARRRRLDELARETRTLVLFEAPHRIAALLDDLGAAFGSDRAAAVARELSKTWETVYRGTLAELSDKCTADPNFARGEITVVVAGAPDAREEGDEALAARLLPLLRRELPASRAAAITAQLTGVPRSILYERARALEGASQDSPER
ncbi:16S rRNA (cytidine(1402)-2'-O)-methyltransferase [bacterium]|nr:MAG: 16S rRNA (cytidine(1402)-2'-O)-methyltransferase [bacterium]